MPALPHEVQLLMLHRHAPRYEINVSVKVWGMDRYGRPFMQKARTVDANPLGARLSGIACVRVGEIIGIQYGEEKSRYKVVWVGRDNTPQAGQIGVHCLEPGKRLFRAEQAKISTLAADGFSQSATSFEAPSLAHSVKRPMAEIPPTRRRSKRHRCSGGLELRRSESATPIFASLSDISLEGCYVEASTTLPTGCEVVFLMRARDVQIRGHAMVKISNHAVGMGLEFLNLAMEDQQKLEFLVGTVAGAEDMRPQEQRRPVPDDPIRIPQPLMSRRAAAPLGSAHRSDTPPPVPSAISQKAVRAVKDLNELEQNLVKGRIDPRLIAQFRDAIEYVRQTAWTLQQWADLHSAGGDPFDVLPQLDVERMQMLRRLAHNVTADIDAGSTNNDTLGISELHETVEALYRRLRKMLVEDPLKF